MKFARKLWLLRTMQEYCSPVSSAIESLVTFGNGQNKKEINNSKRMSRRNAAHLAQFCDFLILGY